MPLRIRRHIPYPPRPAPAAPPPPVPHAHISQFTDEEAATLKRLWADYSIKRIAVMMHRSTRTISTNAKKLGLPPRDAYGIIVDRLPNTPPCQTTTTPPGASTPSPTTATTTPLLATTPAPSS